MNHTIKNRSRWAACLKGLLPLAVFLISQNAFGNTRHWMAYKEGVMVEIALGKKVFRLKEMGNHVDTLAWNGETRVWSAFNMRSRGMPMAQSGISPGMHIQVWCDASKGLARRIIVNSK
jgi:hypothetical protein